MYACHDPTLQMMNPSLLGKLADVSAQLLERLWLRWNPAYHLKEATV